MKNTLALLLLASALPLNAGCLEVVHLAASDVPPAGDVPPTPDVPPTGDVPPTVDAPRDDGTAPDAPTLPYCPEEVDYNAAQRPDLRYRRAAFALPPDRGKRLDPGGSVGLIGTWAGTRTLEAPIVLGCPAGDARYACRADTVIEVALPDGSVHGFVVTLSPGDLTAFTVGMPVSLRARASQWDGATPLDYEGVLTVRRPGDERLLLAIVTGQSPPADLEVIAAQREAVCRSRPEPLCRRVLTAYRLQFGTSSGARVVAPGEEAIINEGGSLLCRNRVAYARTPSGGGECADLTRPVVSFEIVRQP